MSAATTIERIDTELLQTQYGERGCGHDDCRPYTVAIVESKAINHCPPGEKAARDRLAALTDRPPPELIKAVQTPLLAVIHEAECIGCTKCIQACPVDAILGAAKHMHTVIESECTGCELCIAPCPVDCIDLVQHPRWAKASNDIERQHYLDWRAENGRRRLEARNHRLAIKAEQKHRKREQRRGATSQQATKAPPTASCKRPADVDVTALKAQIATLTARRKRLHRQLDKAEEAQRPVLLERLAGFDDQLDALNQRLESVPSQNQSTARNHQHIALAAAEQAMRKARQELAHFQRQDNQAGIKQARDKIHRVERLISLSRSPVKQPAKSAGNHPGTDLVNTTKREQIFARFKSHNPEPTTELNWSTPFELLAAVLLSAQATDAGVKKATARLFPVANTPQAIIDLGIDELREHIKTIGLFNTKAENLMKTCYVLIERYAGDVPRTREGLEALPGVGRKTANVILNTAFGELAMAVDTHVFRVANRTRIAKGKNVLEVEQKLLRHVPKAYLKDAHHWLILHGRYTCLARKPRCGSCLIKDLCEYPDKINIT